MPLLFLCKSFDLISDAARLKLARTTMTVEQILIFIFFSIFFSSESMPGLLLSVVRHQILISQFMIDHLSYLTSPLSDLLAVMLVLTVRAEISD